MKPLNNKETSTFDLSHYDLQLAMDKVLRSRYNIPEDALFELSYTVTPDGDRTTVRGYYTSQKDLPTEQSEAEDEI